MSVPYAHLDCAHPGRPTHNIMLSPYVDYTIGSRQYTWLLNDLQAIDRTVTPFVRS